MLVGVPCGRSKIWDREPERGAVSAADVYTGTPFRLNRQYAECFGDAWVVLSAKYGFIAPDFTIPESYEVSFTYPATRPIPLDRLRQQVREQKLGHYPVIVGLGGKEYRAAMRLPSLTCCGGVNEDHSLALAATQRFHMWRGSTASGASGETISTVSVRRAWAR